MSLPLTRRIARAALLIAAGAAAVVGAAGSASAAPAGLPATPNLGGLTALDSAGSAAPSTPRSRAGPELADATGGRRSDVPAAAGTTAGRPRTKAAALPGRTPLAGTQGPAGRRRSCPCRACRCG